jgi:hypothetical protein
MMDFMDVMKNQISMTNNTDAPIGIKVVIDPTVPGSPPRKGNEKEHIVDPGKSIVLFRTPGVSYVVGHWDSVANRTEKKTVLSDGTVRTDVKENRPWLRLKPIEKATAGMTTPSEMTMQQVAAIPGIRRESTHKGQIVFDLGHPETPMRWRFAAVNSTKAIAFVVYQADSRCRSGWRASAFGGPEEKNQIATAVIAGAPHKRQSIQDYGYVGKIPCIEIDAATAPVLGTDPPRRYPPNRERDSTPRLDEVFTRDPKE